MNGGSTAKNAYRYQDWCAMYFALESFKDDSSFENIYCEQGKLDFEIWSASSFVGFQVKSNPATLTAKETNNIFLFYSNRSLYSQKQNKSFRFIFCKYPTKSLGHLFTTIRGENRGVQYGRQIQRYINTALKNIPVADFSIDFHFFEEKDIRQKVFSLSTEILKDKVGEEHDIKVEVINNFIARLRDEIDKISCKVNNEERNFSFNQIELLINNFIRTFRAEQLEDGGSRTIIIELPKDSLKVNKQKITIEMEPIEANKSEEGELKNL